MKVHAILNRDGGTLKTTDLELLSRVICDEFRLHGHEIEVEQLTGSELGDAIARQAKRSDLDALMVGGGDGTVSGAAAAVAGSGIALAILPAGTMNLFARTLQIPLDLDDAVKSLANGRIVDVDIASVNGEYFIHQFAVGLHARMVRTRDRLDYGSRIGKMWASTRAIVSSIASLPMVRLDIEIDGKLQSIETPAVAISNNIYGEGHLPYADNPQGSCLGVYIGRTSNSLAMAGLALNILRGSWKNNDDLWVRSAKTVRIEYSGRKRRNRAVMDGELKELAPVSNVRLHPNGLKVVVPEEARFSAELSNAQTVPVA